MKHTIDFDEASIARYDPEVRARLLELAARQKVERELKAGPPRAGVPQFTKLVKDGRREAELAAAQRQGLTYPGINLGTVELTPRFARKQP